MRCQRSLGKNIPKANRMEEYHNKLEVMKKKYGLAVYEIIDNNDKVDRLATSARGNPENKNKIYEGSNRYRIIKNNNGGNTLKEIKEYSKTEREKIWIAKSENKYLIAARRENERKNMTDNNNNKHKKHKQANYHTPIT
jgi:hypothetical protein